MNEHNVELAPAGFQSSLETTVLSTGLHVDFGSLDCLYCLRSSKTAKNWRLWGEIWGITQAINQNTGIYSISIEKHKIYEQRTQILAGLAVSIRSRFIREVGHHSAADHHGHSSDLPRMPSCAWHNSSNAVGIAVAARPSTHENCLLVRVPYVDDHADELRNVDRSRRLPVLCLLLQWEISRSRRSSNHHPIC